MTTATTYRTPAASNASGGWLSRFFERMMAAQLLVARKRVAEHLRTMSDEQLYRVGFNAKEIANIRAGGLVEFPG